MKILRKSKDILMCFFGLGPIHDKRQGTRQFAFMLYQPFQGISFSIIGPTLLDLQELTHSTTDGISIVLIIKYVSLVECNKRSNFIILLERFTESIKFQFGSS